jgi:hypothetical protein
MKRIIAIFLSVTLLFGTLSYSGCIGSFGLTQKVYDFNVGVGDKWVNELVFLAMFIIPVYEVSFIIDFFIINMIEFWSGDNPVSYVGEDGKHFVKSGDDTYEMIKYKKNLVFNKVISEGEDSYQIIIDKKSRSAYINQNGVITKLAEYTENSEGLDAYVVYKPNGEALSVNAGPNLKYNLFEVWNTSGAFAVAK